MESLEGPKSEQQCHAHYSLRNAQLLLAFEISSLGQTSLLIVGTAYRADHFPLAVANPRSKVLALRIGHDAYILVPEAREECPGLPLSESVSSWLL